MSNAKGKGKIWPEYWIDCCKCEHHEPLATSKNPATVARKQGWRRFSNSMDGPWMCPDCAANDKDAK